jgi:hypothetical protein
MLSRLAVTGLFLCFGLIAQDISFDTSAVQAGPVSVQTNTRSVAVSWRDEQSRLWRAEFSLNPAQPLITAISVEGKVIVDGARPYYRCETGKRRGGWDAFFDFPPSHPDGTRSFLAEFHPKSGRARTIGDRVEVAFDGMQMGIFSGQIEYIFYPGSRLIEQQAAMSTQEPDTAYFYDAGLRMRAPSDETLGLNMDSHISYYDTRGDLQTIVPAYASEREPLTVRYRTLAARSGQGTVAVFPAPHQYLFARDYTTNMGYVWYASWRGTVSLGIRQLPDDDTSIYPWMNAPPGTEQEMRMFLLVDDKGADHVLQDVLRYTHSDRYPKLPGYVTFEPHWHLAFTPQAVAHGLDWTPPFKPAMQNIGLDAAMIMDFHLTGEGHPHDLTDLRLQELSDYFKACRAQSNKDFLLIPAEEANVFLGGHYGIVFPKAVYWFMDRKPGEPFRSSDPRYGMVYRVSNSKELWDVVQAEEGYVYQTHPRTKGSTGYPDAIKETDYFRDSHYLGVGWKAMPSDLSSPRLGERAFKTLDDLNNWGFRKRMIGEVDVFQLDSTHELYGHMNVNYVHIAQLPSYDHYDQLLQKVADGDYFITTGEITIPGATLEARGDRISARAAIAYTFPLRLAEIVWGDGADIHRKIISLDNSHEFGKLDLSADVDAPGWKWVRLAVWDIAGDGAFMNPVWKNGNPAASSPIPAKQ